MDSGGAIFIVIIIVGFLVMLIASSSKSSGGSGSGGTKSSGTGLPPASVPPAGTPPASGAAIHKSIPNKRVKKSKPQQIVSLYANTGTEGIWICPVCDAENPYEEAVCCVCHNVKGR